MLGNICAYDILTKIDENKRNRLNIPTVMSDIDISIVLLTFSISYIVFLTSGRNSVTVMHKYMILFFFSTANTQDHTFHLETNNNKQLN